MGLDQQAKTYNSPCHPKQSLPGPLSPSVSRSIKCGPIPVPTTGGARGCGLHWDARHSLSLGLWMDRPRPYVGVAHTSQAEVPTRIISVGGGHSGSQSPVLLIVPKEAGPVGETAGVKEALISTFLQG